MSYPTLRAQASKSRDSTMAVTQRLAAAVPVSDLIHELITQRAYLKWKSRGCLSNTALQDWLEAEAEVRTEIRRKKRS